MKLSISAKGDNYNFQQSRIYLSANMVIINKS